MTRRSKYGNVKVEADGYTFDSKMEYRRYQELKLLQQAGEIYGLKVHPWWTINVNGTPNVCKVVADFEYFLGTYRKQVVEDVKGKDNALSKLKRKLLKASYGIDMILIKKVR